MSAQHAAGDSSATAATPKSTIHSDSTFDYDVAIIGGGIAGIYTAWRLMQADPSQVTIPNRPAGTSEKLKVAVFEGSDRIGGRLLTAHPPGHRDSKCELGGMRYREDQKFIRGLVAELGLKGRELEDSNKNIAFLRNERFCKALLRYPEELPYKLEPKEERWVKEDGAGDLMKSALLDCFPELKAFANPADPASAEPSDTYRTRLYKELRHKSWKGKRLFKWGFGDLMADIMSSEAFLLVRAVSGFDCLLENVNAVDCAMESLNFTADKKYYLVKGGFDAVPRELQAKFEKLGGEVIRKTWLAGFEVIDGRPQGVRLKFYGDRPPATARAIVLAMPRRSIELILPESPALDQGSFREWLGAVRPIPLFKVFVRYPMPWWNEYGYIGHSITDGPVRQCWYWDSEDNDKDKAMIMSYSDMTSAAYWRQFGSPTSSVAIPLKDHAGVSSDSSADKHLRNWQVHSAPELMLAEMHRELLALHGLKSEDTPAPIDGVFMDWSDDPYGGAVHLWNPGYKSWKLVKKMIHPVPGLPCYICGEAYSTNQTFVEGALETAERLMTEHFIRPHGEIVTAVSRGS